VHRAREKKRMAGGCGRPSLTSSSMCKQVGVRATSLSRISGTIRTSIQPSRLVAADEFNTCTHARCPIATCAAQDPPSHRVSKRAIARQRCNIGSRRDRQHPDVHMHVCVHMHICVSNRQLFFLVIVEGSFAHERIHIHMYTCASEAINQPGSAGWVSRLNGHTSTSAVKIQMFANCVSLCWAYCVS
jgi:hypothetical protein